MRYVRRAIPDAKSSRPRGRTRYSGRIGAAYRSIAGSSRCRTGRPFRCNGSDILLMWTSASKPY